MPGPCPFCYSARLATFFSFFRPSSSPSGACSSATAQRHASSSASTQRRARRYYLRLQSSGRVNQFCWQRRFREHRAFLQRGGASAAPSLHAAATQKHLASAVTLVLSAKPPLHCCCSIHRSGPHFPAAWHPSGSPFAFRALGLQCWQVRNSKTTDLPNSNPERTSWGLAQSAPPICPATSQSTMSFACVLGKYTL